jgi:hypothetical protein
MGFSFWQHSLTFELSSESLTKPLDKRNTVKLEFRKLSEENKLCTQ